MSDRKQAKTRLPEYDYERFKQALDGNTTVNDYLAGAIYDLVDGARDGDYIASVAALRELTGEVAEIDGRINQIDKRIEDLQARREELVGERDEKQERIESLEDDIVEMETRSDGDAPGAATVEDVAHDLLVDVAEQRIGTNGLVEGLPEVREAALRANTDPKEVVLEMREQARPAAEAVSVIGGSLDGAFRVDTGTNPIESYKFDLLRRAIAEDILDEGEVDWSKVPDK